MSDSNVKNYMVTIASSGRIPFINRSGPISQPTSIAKAIVEQLTALGYQVKIHPQTAIDSVTGNRAFVALEEGSLVEVDTEEADNAFTPNPSSIDDSQITDQVTEIVPPADVVDEVQENTVAENTTEESQEEVQIEIYDMETYQSWNLDVIRKYLLALEDYLDADLLKDVNTSKKADLLKLIEENVLPLANSASE